MNTLLQQTPPWVWAVLLGLLAYGGSQTRTRQLSRTRVLVIPAVMTTLSVASVWQAFGASAMAGAAWAAGTALAVLLNALWLRQPRGLYFSAGRLSVPGSWAPLLLMMLIFWTKYVVTASLATGWRSPADTGFVLATSALLGVGAGSFLSRAVVMWRACASPERAEVPAGDGSDTEKPHGR